MPSSPASTSARTATTDRPWRVPASFASGAMPSLHRRRKGECPAPAGSDGACSVGGGLDETLRTAIPLAVPLRGDVPRGRAPDAQLLVHALEVDALVVARV